jgi:hypothetical protein
MGRFWLDRECTKHVVYTTHALSSRGNRDISDIIPRRPRFTKQFIEQLIPWNLWKILGNV